jgi:hypothetical protein
VTTGDRSIGQTVARDMAQHVIQLANKALGTGGWSLVRYTELTNAAIVDVEFETEYPLRDIQLRTTRRVRVTVEAIEEVHVEVMP